MHSYGARLGAIVCKAEAPENMNVKLKEDYH
jgi:hypothetical protein